MLFEIQVNEEEFGLYEWRTVKIIEGIVKGRQRSFIGQSQGIRESLKQQINQFKGK